jgi:hypothetical protein
MPANGKQLMFVKNDVLMRREPLPFLFAGAGRGGIVRACGMI